MSERRGFDPNDDPVAAEPRLASEMLAFAEEHLADARAELDRAYDRDDEERIRRARESVASAEELLASARRRIDATTLDPNAILDHIRATCDGIDVLTTPGCVFIYYDPERAVPHDRRQPFATIVTNDRLEGASDQASELAARDLFRVNLGVERASYRAMLGPEPAWGRDGGVIATDRDLTQRDVWLPHPIYAPMSWVAIVAPSEASWPRLRELIAEAHTLAKRRTKP